MSRNIKSLKKLHSLIGQVVHVVDSEGHAFDAVVEKCSIPGNPNGYAVDLVTAYDIADKDPYWWPKSVSEKTWGHHVVRPHQLTEELRSVTTIKGKAEAETVKTTTKSYVSFMDLLANEGHYCEMADGTTGYIAGSKYPQHVCVIHNSEGPSEGWTISRFCSEEEILGVSKSFIKRFSKAWHVGSEDEAEQVKVAEILDKVCKSKKAKQKKVTEEDLEDAEDISVVEILEDDSEKCAESSKTILDMTIREVLEKLDEIIKR